MAKRLSPGERIRLRDAKRAANRAGDQEEVNRIEKQLNPTDARGTRSGSFAAYEQKKQQEAAKQNITTITETKSDGTSQTFKGKTVTTPKNKVFVGVSKPQETRLQNTVNINQAIQDNRARYQKSEPDLMPETTARVLVRRNPNAKTAPYPGATYFDTSKANERVALRFKEQSNRLQRVGSELKQTGSKSDYALGSFLQFGRIGNEVAFNVAKRPLRTAAIAGTAAAVAYVAPAAAAVSPIIGTGLTVIGVGATGLYAAGEAVAIKNANDRIARASQTLTDVAAASTGAAAGRAFIRSPQTVSATKSQTKRVFSDKGLKDVTKTQTQQITDSTFKKTTVNLKGVGTQTAKVNPTNSKQILIDSSQTSQGTATTELKGLSKGLAKIFRQPTVRNQVITSAAQSSGTLDIKGRFVTGTLTNKITTGSKTVNTASQLIYETRAEPYQAIRGFRVDPKQLSTMTSQEITRSLILDTGKNQVYQSVLKGGTLTTQQAAKVAPVPGKIILESGSIKTFKPAVKNLVSSSTAGAGSTTTQQLKVLTTQTQPGINRVFAQFPQNVAPIMAQPTTTSAFIPTLAAPSQSNKSLPSTSLNRAASPFIISKTPTATTQPAATGIKSSITTKTATATKPAQIQFNNVLERSYFAESSRIELLSKTSTAAATKAAQSSLTKTATATAQTVAQPNISPAAFVALSAPLPLTPFNPFSYDINFLPIASKKKRKKPKSIQQRDRFKPTLKAVLFGDVGSTPRINIVSGIGNRRLKL